MADLKGANYKLAYVDVPSARIPAGDVSGELKICRDEHTFAAEATTADVIKMALKVPAGARVIEAGIISPSLGTTGIMALGTATDPDALIAAADAGGQAVKALAAAGAADLMKEVTAETFYQISFTANTQAATGLKVQAYVIYQDY